MSRIDNQRIKEMTPSPPTQDITFWHAMKPRWGDMDALGHVNNALYFKYFEEARIAFLEALYQGKPFDTQGEGPILATISCQFKKTLHYPQAFWIGLGLNHLGGKSMTLTYTLVLSEDESLVATGDSVLVWMDYQSGLTKAIPAWLRDRLHERPACTLNQWRSAVAQ
jgi:acyl-CoA thioester hydrolase